MKEIFFISSLMLLFLSNLSYGLEKTGKEVQEDEGMGGASLQVAPLDEFGMLTGVVVGVNKSKGTLDIRIDDGGISRFKIDEDAKDQLKGIKPGDRIAVTLTIEVKALEPKG